MMRNFFGRMMRGATEEELDALAVGAIRFKNCFGDGMTPEQKRTWRALSVIAEAANEEIARRITQHREPL